MKCLLLALTGMGNAVLERCLAHELVDETLVVTRAETGPFPYYPCENLTAACERLGVRALTGADLRAAETLATLRDFGPDIIVSATFHQIVAEPVLSLAPLGIFNFHPSLLPAYKGPMPTNWAILHGESRSGLTVHEMTSGLDEGRVVLQRAVDIRGDCDGELRRPLDGTAAQLADELFRLAASGGLVFRQQQGPGSYHPRVLSDEGLRRIARGDFALDDIRRAVTPWPGMAALAARIPGLPAA